jgi:putative redox protein
LRALVTPSRFRKFCILVDEGKLLMDVEILYLGDVKFEAIARGHRVICDQPATNGGSDSGMTPPEFLLVSLGTCAGFYAAQYLKTRSLPADGLRIKVTAEKAAQPARLGRFLIEVTAPELDPQHQAGILRAVKLCLIHNTLLHAPAIDIVLNAPAAVPAA